MHQIKVDNITIDIIRKDIKNIHLTVYPPQGKVRISSPRRITDDVLRLFAVSKLAWIRKQQRKYQEQEAPHEYAFRESHYFLGRKYLLHVIDHAGKARIELQFDTIDLYCRKETSPAERQTILTRWYRRELKKMIPALLAKWEQIVGVTASAWGVKLMKTRWGTCSINAKRIWLNLELVKKPLHCLEYVIAHELVHLKERKHNDRFKKFMDAAMPKWRDYKAELNRFPLGHTNWNNNQRLEPAPEL